MKADGTGTPCVFCGRPTPYTCCSACLVETMSSEARARAFIAEMSDPKSSIAATLAFLDDDLS